MDAPHTCPASGGAHRFRPDAAGVPMCACGEIETSPDEALWQAELESPPFPGEVLTSRARRRLIVAGVDAMMRDKGFGGMDIDRVHADQEASWTAAGGLLHPQDR